MLITVTECGAQDGRSRRQVGQFDIRLSLLHRSPHRIIRQTCINVSCTDSCIGDSSFHAEKADSQRTEMRKLVKPAGSDDREYSRILKFIIAMVSMS
jgi:hypothetical protein